MSEEQARQRAQELTKKALAEAENETFKIDRSLQGKHIVTKSEKAAKKKEEKRIENEMRRSSDKPAFLVLIAGIFEKFLHIIVTLYTMAIVVNILFVWQIYKAVSAGGWQAVFHSKYTLFVLAYFALLFILKKVYFALYTYASGKCYCARISGHTYVAHLDGVAYLGTVAVAKTGFNTVSWRP